MDNEFVLNTVDDGHPSQRVLLSFAGGVTHEIPIPGVVLPVGVADRFAIMFAAVKDAGYLADATLTLGVQDYPTGQQ